MKTVAAAALSAALLAAPAFAQAPLDGNSLTWLVGDRVHTNANGSKVYEAFIGPLNASPARRSADRRSPPIPSSTVSAPALTASMACR